MTWREFDALAVTLRGRIRRDDARAARICQVIVGSMSGKSMPLEDFMPVEDSSAEEAQQITPEQMAAKINFVMQQLGGKSQ